MLEERDNPAFSLTESLSTIYIYESVHYADPVDSHLQELHEWDITPDFVGLELPMDGESMGEKAVLRRSPGTGIALWIGNRIQKAFIQNGSSNASRWDAEYEAGRRYADERGISHGNVDRSRSNFLDEYFTLKQKIRDALLLGLSFIMLYVVLMLVYRGVILFLDRPASLSVLIGIISHVGVAVMAFLFGLSILSGITSSFANEIRENRDEKMYEETVRWCSEIGGSTALIIAGKNHSSGIAKVAEQEGARILTRSAPSAERIDGTSFGWKEAKKVYLD